MKKKLKLLLPLHLHENIEEIIQKIEYIVPHNNVEYFLLHVIEDIPVLSYYSDSYALWEEFREQAVKHTLAGMTQYLKAFSRLSKNVEVIIDNGSVSDQILAIADTLDVDIIVVGTHTREGLNHLMHSNIAEKVVRHTFRSVFTYHIQK